MKSLEEFLILTQEELFRALQNHYKGHTIIGENSYILVQGKAPIMLIAHLDTVHQNPVQQICKTENGNILMSPQGIGGDDRCGVYALVKTYEMSPIKPWLLFTCDEEIGGIGARMFCTDHIGNKLPKEVDKLKLLIEIDRKGKNDAVYYDCDNQNFEKYITNKGFKTAYGSFSDISYIAPELGIAAVNLSSGYYNAHTLHEHINRKYLNSTIQKVTEIVADATKSNFLKYEYVKKVHCDWDDWELYGGFPKKLKITQSNQPKLKNIPDGIREEYSALLEFYTEKELEDIRGLYGDGAILMLFDIELGDYNGSYQDEEENKSV